MFNHILLPIDGSDTASLAVDKAIAMGRAFPGTKLRADVAFCAPGALPNDGKVIEDARSYQ